MDDAATEAKLRDAGFTEKEIASIKEWSQKDNVSCQETVRQIKRSFITGLVILFVMAFFDLYMIFMVDIDNFWIYLLNYCLILVGFFIFAPLKMGTKIMVRLRGRIRAFIAMLPECYKSIWHLRLLQ